MLTTLNLVLDLMIALAACLSAWFWWAASRQRVRRISRTEELDAGDMNRIVTALNRTQILNAGPPCSPPSRLSARRRPHPCRCGHLTFPRYRDRFDRAAPGC